MSQLSERRAQTEVDSAEWFLVGCELVIAQLDVHVPAALATAEGLWDAAERVPLRGAAVAAAALAEYAAWLKDGAPGGRKWRERAATLPEASSPAAACYYHIGRARTLCVGGEHGAEAEHAIPAHAAAVAADSPVLRLHVARMMLHAMPQRGARMFRQHYTDLKERLGAAELECFAPWVELGVLEESLRGRTVVDGPQHLATAEREAQRQGNRRVLGAVAVARAHARIGPHDYEAALAQVHLAAREYDLLGDRAASASVIDLEAWIELRRKNLPRAEELIGRADELVRERGYTDVEHGIRRTKFDLAVSRRDGDTVAALRDAIELRASVTKQAGQHIARIEAKLAAAEREHEATQRSLAAEVAAASERARAQRMFAAGVVIVALSILAAGTWYSRRKLLVANTRLGEQIARVEAAKQAQAQLEERMRQLERTESLGTMAAGVAHDFNNLLTSILGNAELIASATPVEDPVVLARHITLAGQQATRLCRQLQTYAGGAPLQRESLDLGSWAVGMLPVLRASTQGKLDLRIVGNEVAVGASVDRAQLEQALLNLVINARDARAHRVVIRVGKQEPPNADDVPMAFLAVADDGEGMSQDVAQRVFDPFFTTRFPGRGLGLAVVYGVARRHGGTVDVASAVGRGTTFTLRLPAADPPPVPAGEREAGVVLPWAPVVATVLLVDDDAILRQMVHRMLTALGHVSTGFDDGASLVAAAALAPADRPLVLFVDLAMPGMEGDEVIRRVRDLRPDVRAVLMSGHAQALVEQVVAAIKPDYVLVKPFQLDALRAAFTAVLAPYASAVRHGEMQRHGESVRR